MNIRLTGSFKLCLHNFWSKKDIGYLQCPYRKFAGEKSRRPKRERRPLVKNVEIEQPSTSYQPALQYCDFDDFTKQLEKKNIQPWPFKKSNEGEMRIHLHDQLHSVSKYIVVVNSSLEFTIFVF